MDQSPVRSSSSEVPAFGHFSPGQWQAFIISLTRQFGTGWFEKRLAFLLRRLACVGTSQTLDLDVHGIQLRLRRSGNLCEKRLMFTPQYFDRDEIDFLRAHAARASRPYVFLDVGANIGAYSLFVAQAAQADARIYAFEPQPDIFTRLCQHISFNSRLPSIKALQLALSDHNGDMTLFVDLENSGESSVKMVRTSDHDHTSMTIQCQTLETFLHTEHLEYVNAMKLDVEGAEDLILIPFFEHAPDVLMPEVIVMERAHAHGQRDIMSFASKRGYRVVKTTRLNVILERSL